MRYALLLLAAGCTETPPPETPTAAHEPPRCQACATTIALHNDMGPTFTLVSAAMALDDEPPWQRADDKLAAERSFELVVPDLRPGTHLLRIDLSYRGNGYGVFSYLRGYRFRVQSSHTFDVRDHLLLEVHAYEKESPLAPIEERPAVRFVERG